MDHGGQPKKEVPSRSQSESQKNVDIPACEGENSKDDPRQTKDEPVNKPKGEPILVFAVDKKVLEAAAIGLRKEATVWDVYNNEAKKADDELVKDWRDNLGSLLLFAAIFAAILTAFIIESKNMLEQDPTELLVNVAIFSINNMGNVSKLPFVPPAFVPTSAAISINCLLFASLGASLVAALAAVVSLQWVAEYDAAITRGGSSPEDLAKRRQFRFAGVLTWGMGEIIASLPLLLYSSVVLFWAGAIQWMWMLHPTVGYVLAGGTAMAVLFYASTTLLGAIYTSTPFKTPLSRAIYWVYQSTIYLVRELLSSHQAWITYRQREDRAAAKDLSLTQQALAWLADQITSSANSNIRLQLLVDEVVKQSQFYDAQFSDAPSSEATTSADTSWLKIFDSLSWHYLRKILDGTLSENDHETVGFLVQRSSVDRQYLRLVSVGQGPVTLY